MLHLREKQAHRYSFVLIKKKKKDSLCDVGSCSVLVFQENVDPALRIQQEGDNQPEEEQQKQRRELTVEDEQEIWRDITLTQYKHTNLTPQKIILCKEKKQKKEKKRERLPCISKTCVCFSVFRGFWMFHLLTRF